MTKPIWDFACGHQFTTFEASPFFSTKAPTKKKSSELCPECKESQGSQTSQNRKDEQAVSIWAKQVEGIKAHIGQATARGDEDTVKELEKMLKNCNTLWANKVEAMETRGAANELALKSPSETLREDFQKWKKKINALIEAHKVLNPGANPKEGKLLNLEELKTLVETVEQRYMNEVKTGLSCLEASIKIIREGFAELIPDTSTAKLETS
ncbi:hypothetical protein EG329_010942 [Mollisiaceae sp. DMI_Dod_QoI]|nr:hypothetical protein EG329_010942 [Helotiales sp. DMI_Dod_QoI]